MFTLLKTAGEHIATDLRAVLRYEHLHRYALCGDLVDGKDVLVVGAGEGYGCAMLARTARSVVGVDGAGNAVPSARRRFYRPNQRSMEAPCTTLPVADAAVDVVVCFDAIERTDRHDELLAEIRRLLKPDGILVIGSPNQQGRPGEGAHDAFRAGQLYFDDFAALIQRYFANVTYHGQRLAAASFVYPLAPDRDGLVTPYMGSVERVERRLTSLKSPGYFIALCTVAPRGADGIQSLFIDAEEDLLQILEQERDELAERCDELIRRLADPAALSSDGALQALPRASDIIEPAPEHTTYVSPVGVATPAGEWPQPAGPASHYVQIGPELGAARAEIERLRNLAADLDSQIAFQATRLLERADEIWSAERRIANQSDALIKVQRDAEIRIAESDQAAALLTERAAATARELVAATARLYDLERALEDARNTRAAESQALAALRRDDAEFRIALSTMSSELDRWRSRAEAAFAEAARSKRALEDAQNVLAAATASRAWRLANWLHRRGGGARP